ncbi:MAG: hypothetical protein ABSA85_03730 [Terracidiphilus sp.]
MKRIVRKLTTKPVWWWERKRQYSIRFRHDLLPPLTVEKGPVQFAVLTTPEALNDALWAAWSWYRFLQPHGFELQLAVDGEIAETERSAAQRLFPGVSIYDVNPIIASLCEGRPALKLFFEHHAPGKQVGLTLALSRLGPVLYSDHDVVAFNPPVELLACVERYTPCYFLDDANGCHDPSLVEIVHAMGLETIRRLNAGFLYIPHNALSIDLAEQILTQWNPVPHYYYTPQTVMSTLMRSANAQPLPEDRYVISNQRQFHWEKDVEYGAIAARHFTGTVRHVLYKYGMPLILQQSRDGIWEKQTGTKRPA